MPLRRSQMNRRTVGLKRAGRWRAKLTAKRQAKRERRAAWAVAVLARDRQCVFTLDRVQRSPWNQCDQPSTDAHHVLARSQGGADDLSNGLGLCRRHHRYVHDHRIEAQALGLLAHWGDCSELPVARPGQGG